MKISNSAFQGPESKTSRTESMCNTMSEIIYFHRIENFDPEFNSATTTIVGTLCPFSYINNDSQVNLGHVM